MAHSLEYLNWEIINGSKQTTITKDATNNTLRILSQMKTRLYWSKSIKPFWFRKTTTNRINHLMSTGNRHKINQCVKKMWQIDPKVINTRSLLSPIACFHLVVPRRRSLQNLRPSVSPVSVFLTSMDFGGQMGFGGQGFRFADVKI